MEEPVEEAAGDEAESEPDKTEGPEGGKADAPAPETSPE
jgi:hypothetical protein